jgi:hypothetical protein
VASKLGVSAEKIRRERRVGTARDVLRARSAS